MPIEFPKPAPGQIWKIAESTIFRKDNKHTIKLIRYDSKEDMWDIKIIELAQNNSNFWNQELTSSGYYRISNIFFELNLCHTHSSEYISGPRKYSRLELVLETINES